MWRRILVPHDGPECAEAAFVLAMDFAAQRASELMVCTVVDAHRLGSIYSQAGSWFAQLSKDADEIVSDACAATVLFEEPLHNAIVAFAEKQAADAIVMGTHGRSGLARALMGSVAENVLKLARCAVVTVRPTRSTRSVLPQPSNRAVGV